MSETSVREGSLSAPTRHPVDWRNPEFFNESKLFSELERVYDICHGCRRCVSLCHSFPTLFDLVDGSRTMEVDGVAKADYWQVVDHCYLCDLCYLTKCPYVPPHDWNVDFPHLMLRAKAVKFKQGKTRYRDQLLTATDMVGNIAGIPVVAPVVNAVNRIKPVRQILDKAFGVHQDAPLPEFHSNTLRKRMAGRKTDVSEAQPAGTLQGKVALFTTCYGNRNAPAMVMDLVKVFEHNGIPVRLTERERCCGMPKLELGDLEAVQAAKEINIPELLRMVEAGWDIIAPIPSCVLMFKQEIPLLFPDDAAVQKVKQTIFDPFEYLVHWHKAGRLKLNFKNSLGKVAYHVPCHQRVQNIGLKTRDILQLVPETSIEVIERCSGHDGTYAVKSETHAISQKICRPVVSRVQKAAVDHYISDCPMAGVQIQHGLADGSGAESAFSLLCFAYGL